MKERKFTREWQPRSRRGGEQDGQCADHPQRPSVFVFQRGRWIDTGLCATDMRALERADRAVAKAAKR